MLGGTYLQFVGALLFSVVFLFLWKQSKVVYFGYWSIAWAAQAASWLTLLVAPNGSRWMGLHVLLEFVFALVLIAAAEAGSRERLGKFGSRALRALYLFLGFLLVAELIGWQRSETVVGLQALVLSAIYFYSFWKLGLGGRKLFHFTLLALSLLYLQISVADVLFVTPGGHLPPRFAYLLYASYYELGLKTVLAFAAMGMWIETQSNQTKQLTHELDRVRRESAREPNLDRLTGLLNGDSLQQRMDVEKAFAGVVAVCDLDGFKSINDQFGHLVGDDVLRGVGNLVRTSIRAEDQAYRWGGDEFAILFHETEVALAEERMQRLEARLNEFGVRGHGTLRIRMSWGVAEGKGASLREAMERADREMYGRKRAHAQGAVSGGEEPRKSAGLAGGSQASSTMPS